MILTQLFVIGKYNNRVKWTKKEKEKENGGCIMRKNTWILIMFCNCKEHQFDLYLENLIW